MGRLDVAATEVVPYEAEMREAVHYFAALPATSWVRVIEAETVPATRVAA